MHYLKKLWALVLIVIALFMFGGGTHSQAREKSAIQKADTTYYAKMAGVFQGEADIVEEDDFHVIMAMPETKKEEPQVQPQQNDTPQVQAESVKETKVSQEESEEALIKSIKEKVANLSITQSTNMSEVIGFTKEELIYALKNAVDKNGNPIIQNDQLEKMAETLGTVISKKASEYQVNELCILGIMSVETGWLNPQKSSYLRKYNNFGGMKTRKGTAIFYETWEEGIEAAIKCIRNNMKGNNTAKEIGSTYCPGSSTWPKQVVSCMTTYKKSFEGLYVT